jgi:hypothetical protein
MDIATFEGISWYAHVAKRRGGLGSLPTVACDRVAGGGAGSQVATDLGQRVAEANSVVTALDTGVSTDALSPSTPVPSADTGKAGMPKALKVALVVGAVGIGLYLLSQYFGEKGGMGGVDEECDECSRG